MLGTRRARRRVESGMFTVDAEETFSVTELITTNLVRLELANGSALPPLVLRHVGKRSAQADGVATYPGTRQILPPRQNSLALLGLPGKLCEIIDLAFTGDRLP